MKKSSMYSFLSTPSKLAYASTNVGIKTMVQTIKLAKAHSCHYRLEVLLVTLNVRNPFNHMLEVLQNSFHIPGYLLQILRDYLKAHTLEHPGRTPQNKGHIRRG